MLESIMKKYLSRLSRMLKISFSSVIRAYKLPPLLCLLTLSILQLVACTDVPASNPYDPESPPEIISRVSIKGVVRDNLTDAGINGATLVLKGPNNKTFAPITTQSQAGQDDGYYEYLDLVPGAYSVSVSHPAYQPAISIFVGDLQPGVQQTESDLRLVKLSEADGGIFISGSVCLETQCALSQQDNSDIQVTVLNNDIKISSVFVNSDDRYVFRIYIR